jgi:hypothetical protein
VLNRRLRLGGAGGLLFGGARNLLGALLGLDRRALRFMPPAESPDCQPDADHVLTSGFQSLDDDRRGLCLIRGSLRRLLQALTIPLTSV